MYYHFHIVGYIQNISIIYVDKHFNFNCRTTSFCAAWFADLMNSTRDDRRSSLKIITAQWWSYRISWMLDVRSFQVDRCVRLIDGVHINWSLSLFIWAQDAEYFQSKSLSADWNSLPTPVICAQMSPGWSRVWSGQSVPSIRPTKFNW